MQAFSADGKHVLLLEMQQLPSNLHYRVVAVDRVLVSEPKLAKCVVEVELAAPYKVQRLGCLPGGERSLGCVLSPRGAWLGCQTMKELAELDPRSTTTINGKTVHDHKQRYRVRTMEAATGKIGIDLTDPQLGFPSAISDDGVLVLHDQGLATVTRDGKTHELPGTEAATLFSWFHSPTELVTESGGAIGVVRLNR